MSKPMRTESVLAAMTLVGMLIGAGGCQLIVNPFVDELASRLPADTPSVRIAREADVEQTEARRPYGLIEVTAKDGTVTHGPLYFEDPFEDIGSEDGEFTWTGEDCLAMVCEPGRFLLNSVLFPISAIVTPPWVVMASDGDSSRQVLWWEHDATRRAGTATAAQADLPSP